MKTLLIACATALALTACGKAAETEIASKTATTTVVAGQEVMMETKTKAVLIYADWCGSCKVLDPAVKQAKELGPLPGAEFVVLDYTDKNDANFYAQAEAAGVETSIRAYLGGKVKTGQLLLVDVDDAKVIEKITKADKAPTIRTKIKAAVSAS